MPRSARDPLDRGDPGVGVLHVEDGVLHRLACVTSSRSSVVAWSIELISDSSRVASGPRTSMSASRRTKLPARFDIRRPTIETSWPSLTSSRSRIDAERLDAGEQARHLAVVVGPEDVDHPVEPADEELVAVVREVAREVGRVAVGLARGRGRGCRRARSTRARSRRPARRRGRVRASARSSRRPGRSPRSRPGCTTRRRRCRAARGSPGCSRGSARRRTGRPRRRPRARRRRAASSVDVLALVALLGHASPRRRASRLSPSRRIWPPVSFT